MRNAWLIAAVLAAATSAPALACSPPPPGPAPTRAQIDESLRTTFAGSADLVEFVVVKHATDGRDGAIRIMRSYKGATRVGRTVAIRTRAGAACGWGDADVGYRGRMFLSGGEPYFYAPLSDEGFAEFVGLGLIPRR